MSNLPAFCTSIKYTNVKFIPVLIFSEKCEAGQQHVAADDTCEACLPGTYKATNGSRDRCIDCPLNMDSVRKAASCDIGRFYCLHLVIPK